MLFDQLFNYERVQEFLERHGEKMPGPVANEILDVIRRGPALEAEEILSVLWLKGETWQKLLIYCPEDARYTVEYYQVWEKLPKEEKDKIKRKRAADYFDSLNKE